MVCFRSPIGVLADAGADEEETAFVDVVNTGSELSGPDCGGEEAFAPPPPPPPGTFTAGEGETVIAVVTTG